MYRLRRRIVRANQTDCSKSFTPNKTVVPHIDTNITAMIESEDDNLHSSTQNETIDFSNDTEDDTCSGSSTGKPSTIQTELNVGDTVKIFNDIRNGVDILAKKVLEWTIPNMATVTNATRQGENLVQDDTMNIFNDINTELENIVKSTLQKRPLNNTTEEITPKKRKRTVQVNMTEENLNKFMRRGLISVRDGEYHFD